MYNNRARTHRLSDGDLPIKKINSAGNEKINFSSYEKISIYKKDKKTNITKPTKQVSPFSFFSNTQQQDHIGFGDSPTHTFQKVDFDKGFFSFQTPNSKLIQDFQLQGHNSNQNQLKIKNSYMSDSSNDDSFELEFEEVNILLILI